MVTVTHLLGIQILAGHHRHPQLPPNHKMLTSSHRLYIDDRVEAAIISTPFLVDEAE